MIDFPSDKMISLYESMLIIRQSELVMTELYRAGKLPGHVLPALGQEAIPAAFGLALKPHDNVVTAHRGGGHYIARGGDFKGLWAELYGRSQGVMGGKGGQLHLIDMDAHIIAGNAVVGANWVLGTGAGFAAKMQGKGAVAAVFGGEGSTNRGTFHEALNLAAVKRLPIVFCVEFNHKQLWSDSKDTTACEYIVQRAAAYGMPGVRADGNDPVAVYQAAMPLIERARRGEGPALMECETYKWTDSGSNFRLTEAEMAHARREDVDPVLRFEKRLLDEGVMTQEEIDAARKKAADTVEAARAYGEGCDIPQEKDTFSGVYSMPVGQEAGHA